MKILIATGIFKPELGGPATLALELSKRLQASGHKVTVLTYSNKSAFDFDKDIPFKLVRIVRTKNKFINYFKYYRAALGLIPTHDIIYTLDWFSAGFPLMMAAKKKKKPYIVRVGGGYIWEKYLTEGKPPVTLKAFYERGLHKKYSVMFWMIKKVLQNAAKVIFNSDDQCTLYEKYYNLAQNKVTKIYNAVPENRLSGLVQNYNSRDFDRDKEIVFAGRFIKMKNVESLVRAFARLKDPTFKLLLIGEGPLEHDLRKLVSELDIDHKVEFLPPLSQSDLYRRIAHCYVLVIPSWTDVSPNQAYECLALGIPLLITKENYLSINKLDFTKIDPTSVDNIADTLNRLLDQNEYRTFIDRQKKIRFHYTWDHVVGEHLKVFMSVYRS